jgi:hypothetical protein
LIRWLHRSDLLFHDAPPCDLPDGIQGAEFGLPPDLPNGSLPATSVSVVSPQVCSRAWVVFHGLQVFQVVPEEVHSYWHLVEDYERSTRTGAWEIMDSTWLASFDQRHLARHKHFLLEFYDELVEVVAEALIFGRGKFDISQVARIDGRFAHAFLNRARAHEKAGRLTEALADFQAYESLATDDSSAAYARRCSESLKRRIASQQ